MESDFGGAEVWLFDDPGKFRVSTSGFAVFGRPVTPAAGAAYLLRLTDPPIANRDGRHYRCLNATPLNVRVAVGTAPGVVQTRPGFSKLRITREGFKPWERTINAFNGQTLTVALEMTPETYARWKDLTSFIADIQNGAKLKDAEVKTLEAKAKMIANSGFKIQSSDSSLLKFFMP